MVQVGCGEGRLAAALYAGDSYVVQGLDADAAKVSAARRNLQALGLYGRVTAETWQGPRLPYIDNLVNLLVLESPDVAAREEILRVLARAAPRISPGPRPSPGGRCC